MFVPLTLLLVYLAPEDLYLWIKAVHVMAVIARMAGMFYLPRPVKGRLPDQPHNPARRSNLPP